MSKSIYWILVLMLVSSFSATAKERVSGLYRVEIDVTDEGASSRSEAIRKGLSEVITRVSGKANISGYVKIHEALKTPSSHVRQFLYKRKGEKTVIEIRYNRASVNKLLADSKLSTWNESRPVTLVWLAIQDGGKRVIINSTNQEGFRALLKTNATRRGTPLLFPLMDLQDSGKVKFSDVSGGFFESIKEASKRYPGDAILVGSMRWYGGSSGWKVNWTLISNGQRKSWTSSGKQKAVVLAAGIDGNANLLAKSFAHSSTASTTTGSGGNILISVSNINSLADYANVTKYLSKLEIVSTANIVKLSGKEALFSVKSQGGKEQLEQQIDQGSVLSTANASEDSSDEVKSDTGNGNNDENKQGDENRDQQAGADANTLYYRYKP